MAQSLFAQPRNLLMKICFYNLTAGFKTGGLETYCWEAGRALARLGHEVDIIGGSGGAPRHDEVRFLAFNYTPRSQFPNLGTRFRKLCERLSFAKNAAKALYEGNYDVVIVNKPYDFPVMWRLKKGGFKGVIVMRSGGTEFYALDRFFARAIDLWLSASAYNARQVEARYGQPAVQNGFSALYPLQHRPQRFYSSFSFLSIELPIYFVPKRTVAGKIFVASRLRGLPVRPLEGAAQIQKARLK